MIAAKRMFCLLAGLPFLCADEAVIFEEADLKKEIYRTENKPLVLKAEFEISSPCKIPMDLGSCFPVLEHLSLKLPYDRETTPPPTDCQRENVVPCNTVRYLNASYHPLSPTDFAWVKLFFPKVNALKLDVRAMPIQCNAVFEPGELEALRMEAVTSIEMEVAIKAKGMERSLPLAENLELFPNLKNLAFRYTAAVDELLSSLVQRKHKLPPLESLKLNSAYASRKLLTDVMEVLPSLKELGINGESFCKLTQYFSEIGNPSSSPFKSIERLIVHCGRKDVSFDAEMAKTFPAVRELVIDSPPYYCPLSTPLKKNSNIEAVEIIGLGQVGCSPSHFGTLFPRLASLSMAKCEFYRLFGEDLSRDKAFFAHLKHLNVSSHRFLDALEPFRLGLRSHQKTPNTLASAGKKVKMTILGRSKAPLAPELEILDIRATFYFSEAPCWFFEAFPNITKLRVSDWMFKYATKECMHELFMPLARLRHLDVELSEASQVPRKEVLDDILNKLDESLKSCLTIQFFATFSPEPVATFAHVPVFAYAKRLRVAQ